MLFFFEAGLFVLGLLAVALAELVSKFAALLLWASATAGIVVAGRLVRARQQRLPPADATERRWRQLLAESLRHTARIMIIGLLAFAGWWGLGELIGAR